MYAVRKDADDLRIKKYFDQGDATLTTGRIDGEDQHLSPDALRLYGAIARQDWIRADEVTQRNPQSEKDLLDWGLMGVDPDGTDRRFVRNPTRALRDLMLHELELAAARVEKLKMLPDLADELATQYRAQQMRSGRGSEYLEDQTLVNARIRDVVGSARREILAAQPSGPRSKEILEVAVERDAVALDRGVALRTIYQDTVRDDVVTAEYARTMSTRPGGRCAEYRTLPGEFVRMVIVDREQAFIPNLVVEGAPEYSGWYVTDRAVVAVLAEMFESKWRLAVRWHGELRPRRGHLDVDTVSGPSGVVTTPRQREIMRLLVSGMTQVAVARRIGVSKRKLDGEIAALKRVSGSETVMQLAHWWAHCPDSLLDTEEADGLEDTEAA